MGNAPGWRLIDIDADAAKIATMWNDSDDQWPGTRTGGVPFTAERVRHNHEQDKPIEILVYDDGDAIGGYCSVWQDHEEPSVAWIALLNVAPAYQGRSLAREVLVYWTNRAAELGYSRLDLGTWGGNLKAVPLYKKTGFFWMPGSWPHLLNFMPEILNLPVAKPFFAKHDWYASLVRGLEQSADDERWEEMKVFTYRFEAGDDRLTVWVDREARAITAVETNDLFVGVIADELEPARGLRTGLRWRVRSARARTVSLICSGSEYLSVEHRETARVDAGATVELRAPVEVAARIPDAALREWKPAPAVRSILVLDDDVVELRTGMRPRMPVEVSTYPEILTLTPGVPTRVTIQLRNRLKQDLAVTVSHTLPEGLHASWSEQRVSISASSFAGAEIGLTADRSAALELPVTVAFDAGDRRVEQPPEPQWVFARAPGALVTAQLKDSIRIENDDVMVFVGSIGAGVSVYTAADHRFAGRESGNPSPPIQGNEFDNAEFDLAVVHEGSRVVVTASAESKENPGFVLTKTVELGAGPLVTIGYRFLNNSASTREFRLAQFVMGRGDGADAILPMRNGLATGSSLDYPGPSTETSRAPEFFDEEWWAQETERGTIGAIWPRDDADEITSGWVFQRITCAYECAPRSRTAPVPIQLYAGRGGWRAVRSLWRRARAIDVEPGALDPEPSRYLRARLERPVVSTNGEADATLLVEHASTRALGGEVVLVPPDGWEPDRTSIDVAGVTWDTPARAPLHFKTTAQPGAYTGRIELHTAEDDLTFDLPLIRLGDGRDVSVVSNEREAQRVLTIDNGLLSIDVMPDFGGIVGSIRTGDVDHLFNSFPTRGTFAVFNEWRGGLSPRVWIGDESQKLWKESFTAETVAVTDASGVRWDGVRQRCSLNDGERGRGLDLEIDVLTTGGSPVVRLTQRVINATTAVRTLGIGWDAFTQPGGGRARTSLVCADATIKAGERQRVARAGHWGATVDPETGAAVGLIIDRPELWLILWGAEGCTMEADPALRVRPESAAERNAFVVITDDVTTISRYTALLD